MSAAPGEQRLCEADFKRLEGVIERAIDKKVPAIIRDELVDIGLATHDPKDRLSAQADMAFLHRARKAFEGASSVVGRCVLYGIIGIVAALLIAGFWQKIGAAPPN